jgi:hypothetical protein
MKLEEAIQVVLNEAEISAIGNKDDSQLEVLQAVTLVRHFFKQYGYQFKEFTISQE